MSAVNPPHPPASGHETGEPRTELPDHEVAPLRSSRFQEARLEAR
jgi:hypothetical protein